MVGSSRTNRAARSRISSGYLFKAGMACILPFSPGPTDGRSCPTKVGGVRALEHRPAANFSDGLVTNGSSRRAHPA